MYLSKTEHLLFFVIYNCVLCITIFILFKYCKVSIRNTAVSMPEEYDEDIIYLRESCDLEDFETYLNYQQQCIFCFEELTNESVCGIQCTHLYHKHCLIQWLELNRCCPICKQLI